MQNSYDVLGISGKATTAEVRLAFRKYAKAFHPDLNSSPKAHEYFIKARIAYQSILDPDANIIRRPSKATSNQQTTSNTYTRKSTQARYYHKGSYCRLTVSAPIYK